MKTMTILILLISAINVSMAQNKLGKAKENLSETSPQEFSHDGDQPSSSSDGESKFLENLVFEALYFVSYGTLIGQLEPRSFYAYPYADGQHGEYMQIEKGAPGKRSEFMISNTMIFHSEVYGNDLKLNYRFLPFLGVEANHLHFFDHQGENTDLGISSMMLNYYRIRENSVSGYWGLGATYVGSGVNTAGFAYNLGMDIYVGKPVSFGLAWKQSFINEETINEFKILARYHLKRIVIHGGFSYYKIGSENFPSTAIGIEYRF